MDLQDFAKELAGETGYIYAAEHVPSKVVLLCKDEKAKSERIIDYVKWCGEKFTKYERVPTLSSASNSGNSEGKEICCGKCK